MNVMTTTTETATEQERLADELAEAEAAEHAASAALEAVEAAARACMGVQPSQLAEATSMALLCRLRRQQVAADLAEAVTVEQTETLGELAERAAADPRLDADRLQALEQAARHSAKEYRDALEAADRAFHSLVSDVRGLLPVVGKSSQSSS